MATETNQVVTELTVVDKGREGSESHLAWLGKVVAKSKEAADAARKQAEEAKKSSDSQTESWSRVAGSFERLKRSMDGSFGTVTRYVKDFDALNKAAIQMVGSTDQINAVLMNLKRNGDLTAQTMNLLANAVRNTGQAGKGMRDAMVEAAGLAQAFDTLKRSVNEQHDYIRKLEKADAELAVKKDILRRAVEMEVTTTKEATAVQKALTDQYNKMAREMDPAIQKSRERSKALLEEMANLRKLREEESRRVAAEYTQSTKTRSQFGGIDFDGISQYTKALYDLQTAYKTSTMTAAEYAKAGERINATLSPAAAAARKFAEEQKLGAEMAARADREAAAAAEQRSRALQSLYERARQGRTNTSQQTMADYRNADQFRTMGNGEGYWRELQQYTKALYDLNDAQRNGSIRGADYDAALKKINETLSPLAANTRRLTEEQKAAAQAQVQMFELAASKLMKQRQAYDDFRRGLDPIYERQQRMAEGERLINDARQRGVISAAEATRQHLMLATSMNEAEKAGTGFLSRLLSIQAVIATFGIGYVAKEIITLADTWVLLEGRMKQVTTTDTELKKTQSDLFEVAQRTRVEFGAVVELYVKMARATEDLGLAQINLGKAMETATKAAQLGGGSREGINAALYQFSQGIASNRLGGDELRSILEQAPGLGKAIADGLGVAYGKLRELGTEGKLTADVVLKALVNAADGVEKAWGKVPITVGQTFTQLQNSILRVVGELNERSKFTQPIIDAMNELRHRIDDPSFKSALIVWGKGFADAASLIVDAFRVLADNFDLVKSAIAGLIAYKVADWFTSLAAAAVGASRALALLIGGGTLATGGIGAALMGIAAAVGLATAAFVYFSQEGKKAADIQDEFNERQKRAKEIQDELTIATGSKLEKLEAERQQLKKNAQAEVDLQIAQINRREYVLNAQSSGPDPDLRARAAEERKQLQDELTALLKHRDEIDKIFSAPGKEPGQPNKPKTAESILPGGADPKKYDELVQKLEQTRESYITADAAALKLKLTQMGASEEQKIRAMSLQEEIDQLEALEQAIRKKDDAQAQSLKEALTQKAIAEAEGAKTVAYYAELNRLMVNSTAEGLRGLAELARASNAAMSVGQAKYDEVFANAMKRIDDTIKRAAPRPTGGDKFSPKSDMKDFEAQTLRNIKANNELAASYDKGTDAIRAAIEAGVVEQNVLRLGEKNRQRIVELVRQEEESKTRLAVSKYLESQRHELEQQKALTDVIADGAGAEKDATLAAQIRVKIRELNINTMTTEGMIQAELVENIMKEIDATQRLNDHKRNMRQAQDSLEQTQMEIALLGEEEHVRERMLFLEQERKRIRDTYGPGESAQSAEAWEMAKRTAAANEELSITNERLDKARALADDVGQFLVDAFVNVDKAGQSVFENIFEGARATAKRFVANLIADFLKAKIFLPLAFQIMGGPVGGMGGFATPYGSLPANSAAGMTGGFGGAPFQSGMFGQGGMLSGVGSWVNSWWNKPITGGARQPTTRQMQGIDDAGQLGYAPGTVNNSMTWGQGIGSGLGGFGMGFGIGAMIKPGNKGVSALSGAAAGALAGASAGPFGAIIGGIAGAIGGLFGNGNKPSNFGAGASIDVGTNRTSNWEDKSNDSVRGTRDKLVASVNEIVDTFEKMGAKFRSGLKVNFGVGERDDWTWSVGSASGSVTKGDTNALISSIFKALGQQAEGLGEDVAFALRHSIETDIKKLGEDLDFAAGFRDQIEEFKSAIKGITQAFKDGKKEGLDFSQSIKDFINNTARVFASHTDTNLPKYADGTPYAARGMALVGERGPELVVLAGGEKIYNAQQTSGMMRQTMIGGQRHYLSYINDNEIKLLRKRGGGIDRMGNQVYGPGGIPAFLEGETGGVSDTGSGGVGGMGGADGYGGHTSRDGGFTAANGFNDAMADAARAVDGFVSSVTQGMSAINGWSQAENTAVAGMLGFAGWAATSALSGMAQAAGYGLSAMGLGDASHGVADYGSGVSGSSFDNNSRQDIITVTSEILKKADLTDKFYSGKVDYGTFRTGTGDYLEKGGSPLSSIVSELQKKWDLSNPTSEAYAQMTIAGNIPDSMKNLNAEIDGLIEAFKKAGVAIPDFIQSTSNAIDQKLTAMGIDPGGGVSGPGGVGTAPGKSPRDLLTEALASRGMPIEAYTNFVMFAEQAGRGEKIDPRRDPNSGLPKDFEGLIKMLDLVEASMREVGQVVPETFTSLRRQLEALDAARKAVDAKIATGGIEPELTETETAVQKLKGYWEGMRGALEEVGYAGDMLNSKLREGLANGLRKMAEKYMDDYNAAMNDAMGRGYLNTVNQFVKGRENTTRDLTALGFSDAGLKAQTLFSEQVKNFVENSNLTIKQLLDLGNTFRAIPEVVDKANEAIRKFMEDFLSKLTQQLNSAGGLGYRNDFMSVLDQRRTNFKDIQDAGFSEDYARQASDFIAAGSFNELLKNASLTNDQLKDLASTFGQYPGVLEAVNVALARNQAAMEKTVFDSLVNAHKILDKEYTPAARATMLGMGINADGDPAFRDRMTGFTNSARNGTAGIGGYQYALQGLEDQFRAGKITAEQFGGMVEYLTNEFDKQRQKQLQAAQQLVQSSTTIQSAYLNLKTMLTGKGSMTGDNALALSGAGYDVSARDALGAFFRKVNNDEESAGGLIWTYDKLSESLKNNELTGEQYTNIINEVNSAWQESTQRIQQAKEELKGFKAQIEDFLDAMDTDNLSVNGPEAKLNAAQSQFREVLAAVQSGDKSKIPDLLQKASTYRELGQSFYNNTQGYDYIDKEVRTALKGVDENTTQQIDKLDKQTIILEDSNGLLASLNTKIDQSRNATVDSLGALRNLEDAHKHENWIQFQSLQSATNSVAGAVQQSVSVQNTQIQYLAQHSQLLAQIAQTTAQQIQVLQQPPQQTMDYAGTVNSIIGSSTVNPRGGRGAFGELYSARWAQNADVLLSIGEIETLQRAAGYQGSFSDSQAWSGFVAANRNKWDTLYNTALGKAYVPNSQRFWGDDPGMFVVNREIARNVGYNGNFGAEFDYWMSFQGRGTRDIVNNTYAAYGYGDWGKYAEGGVHGIRSLVGGVTHNTTMSIFGEGDKPEAYVPLQDGRTIPVTIRYAMSHARSSNDNGKLEELLDRVIDAMERNTTITARGEQATIDNLDELLEETREIRRQAGMNKGKR